MKQKTLIELFCEENGIKIENYRDDTRSGGSSYSDAPKWPSKNPFCKSVISLEEVEERI
jgi:hypothetical protein